jgi:hypothetical protein
MLAAEAGNYGGLSAWHLEEIFVFSFHCDFGWMFLPPIADFTCISDRHANTVTASSN